MLTMLKSLLFGVPARVREQGQRIVNALTAVYLTIQKIGHNSLLAEQS